MQLIQLSIYAMAFWIQRCKKPSCRLDSRPYCL